MVAGEKIKVWDIAVRLFHWSLVVLFTVGYLSGEDESMLHIYSGYGVIALLVFRILWGFVGTKYARFSDFAYGPKAAIEYAKSMLSGNPIHYIGHNPLGGWMVFALLLSLAATTWSGLEAYGAEGHGPLAGKESTLIKSAYAHGDERENGNNKENGNGEHEEDEFWKETHEALSNLTLLLVFLHIAGVAVASFLHRENLARSMVTGYKKGE